MRRFYLMVVVSLSAVFLLAAEGTASASSLSVKLSSNKRGTPASPTINSFTDKSKVNKNIGVDKSEIYLPKGVILSAEKVKRCKKSAEEIYADNGCPRGALIAKGTIGLRTDYPNLPTTKADAELYSGKNISELILVAEEETTHAPFPIYGLIDSAGISGFSYVLSFPDVPIMPLGEESGISIYPLNVKMKLVAKGVYRNPSSCKGSWKFGSRFHYAQGGWGKMAVDKVKCK